MPFALDLDGVVWLGEDRIPGSAEAVARLRAAGEPVVFCTNNSSHPVGDVEAKLERHGIEARGDVLTSAMAAATLVEPGEKERLVRDIGDKRAVILRNHGLLSWGPSVAQAFLTLWTLQQACDVQIAAAAAGAIHPVTPQAIAISVRESGQGEKRTCEDVFAALRRKLDSIDPSYRE